MAFGFRRPLMMPAHRSVCVVGSFTAANPPVLTTLQGIPNAGCSVVRNSAGDYTVTLGTANTLGRILAVELNAISSSATFAHLKVAPNGSSSSGAANFEVLVSNSSGAAADQGTVQFMVIGSESVGNGQD